MARTPPVGVEHRNALDSGATLNSPDPMHRALYGLARHKPTPMLEVAHSDFEARNNVRRHNTEQKKL